MLEQDGAEDAANMMKEAGIKGIKYADAQTRFSKGPKTKNYVIFDDRLISIAKKYGIAIPAAAAMLARMTGEDTSQSYQEAS
jgi:homospermidine synthase